MAIFGNIEILHKKVKKVLDENINQDEKVLFCLVGAFKQSLIALTNRLLIIKTGHMADVPFGARTGSIMYKDITGIETHVSGGLSLEVPYIEILTPSYDSNTKINPAKNLNCLPFNYRQRDEYLAQVKKLEKLIMEAKQGEIPEQNKGKEDIVSKIERLAALYKDGALTEDEFQAAKKRLIER